jgi:hypothetical protein
MRKATKIRAAFDALYMNSDSFLWGLAWFILTALLVTS